MLFKSSVRISYFSTSQGIGTTEWYDVISSLDSLFNPEKKEGRVEYMLVRNNKRKNTCSFPFFEMTSRLKKKTLKSSSGLKYEGSMFAANSTSCL